MHNSSVSPQAHHIVEGLARLGVPKEYVDRQLLVAYLADNEVDAEELIAAIFPSNEHAVECLSATETGCTLEELFQESTGWLEWLIFKGDPRIALQELCQLNAGKRCLCRVVFVNNDVVFRCRTCELHPASVVCALCFKNGAHQGHEYYTTLLDGGVCDCGDVSSWKPSGFCLMHQSTEEIQPLPSKFSNSIGPILDSLFCFWRNKLVPLQSASDHISQKVREELTYVVAKLLSEFCEHSESFLPFISEKLICFHGFMDILVKVEQQFSSSYAVQTLHELLLKLLGEPQFKYEFGKVFLGYYPIVVAECIKENSDEIIRKYPLLTTFSVQIFTDPTLTPRLVKELNLLPMLQECLENIFISCAGYDGRLKVVEWENVYETTIRVVEDIQFVMSLSDVPVYVTREQQDITRKWMRILSFVQGMNSQKIETSMHEKYEKVKTHFILGYVTADIHSYLVAGVHSDVSYEEVKNDSSCSPLRQELNDPDNKTVRLARECSVGSLAGRSLIDHVSKVTETKRDYASIPSSVFLLTFECLRAIDSWLVLENRLGRLSFFSSAFTKTMSKFCEEQLNSTIEVLDVQNSVASQHSRVDLDSGKYLGQEAGCSGSDDISTATKCHLESLKLLSFSEWPDIAYDVSSQDVSVHFPLHRLLSMVLQGSLRRCYGESAFLNDWAATSGGLSSTTLEDFFSNILGDCHPYGFSAFLMEHPLRIRTFFAHVRAGLWYRNKDAYNVSHVLYHSARWSEKGLEHDLFLMQCCAALAPPDLYVKRILERYGLSEYLKLDLERSSECEPILVQEMLTLIIQIVKERRFCGLTTAACLRRELVSRLSIKDATYSQLVKSVPQDLLKTSNLQQILDSIAVYSNPSGLNQGMFNLRMECWKELDLYFPRFDSRELQMAEERYLRFCKISAVTAQLPKWSKIYQPLSGIAQIATCKTVVQIVRAALFYAAFSDESMESRSERELLTAMHLLSLALHICSLQRASDQSLQDIGEVIPILEFACEEIPSTMHADQSLLSLLVFLMRLHEKKNNESNISSLCDNILKKFAELEPKCFIKLQKIAPEVVNQLSECNLPDDSTTGLASDSEKRKAKARERQAAVLERMKTEQSLFLESIESSGSCEDLVDDEVLHDSKDLEEVACSLCHDTNSPLCFIVHLQVCK